MIPASTINIWFWALALYFPLLAQLFRTGELIFLLLIPASIPFFIMIAFATDTFFGFSNEEEVWE